MVLLRIIDKKTVSQRTSNPFICFLFVKKHVFPQIPGMPFLHLLARRYIPGSKSGMMSLLESHCRSGDTFMQPAFLGQLIRSSVRGTLFVGPLPTAKPKAANPHKRCWCAFVCGNSNIACTLEVENLHPLKPNRVVCGMCQRFYVRFTNTYTHAGKNPAVQ